MGAWTFAREDHNESHLNSSGFVPTKCGIILMFPTGSKSEFFRCKSAEELHLLHLLHTDSDWSFEVREPFPTTSKIPSQNSHGHERNSHVHGVRPEWGFPPNAAKSRNSPAKIRRTASAMTQDHKRMLKMPRKVCLAVRWCNSLDSMDWFSWENLNRKP
jgi:hypothetical protein